MSDSKILDNHKICTNSSLKTDTGCFYLVFEYLLRFEDSFRVESQSKCMPEMAKIPQ